jgi:erythronate-4-phosphate dehydrogenase
MSQDLHIVADENIPYVRQAFGALGRVTTVTGRRLARTDVATADMLLVRSVSRVDQTLLKDTPVRFVGTATIGFDHVDRAYLGESGIAFAYAPGSNAISAAEYVLSSLLVMAQRRAFALADKSVAIIGCGNVGEQVRRRLQALGVRCLINDPPRQASEGTAGFVSLAEALQADIVTLHVPLEKNGAWPTAHLANHNFFAALKPDAIFINTARGAVVDECALWQKLADCPNFSAILDVWANEPLIDARLCARVALATPHIAGYSLDGKVRGTEMLYQAACAHVGISPTWSAHAALPPPPLRQLEFSASADAAQILQTAVMACYDVRADDAALRRLTAAPDAGAYFDLLRKNYPIRREFANLTLRLQNPPDALCARLRALDFKLAIA